MDTLIECALALLHNLLCCISVRPERASALRVRPHILGSGITIGAVQLVAIAAEAISALLKVDFKLGIVPICFNTLLETRTAEQCFLLAPFLIND